MVEKCLMTVYCSYGYDLNVSTDNTSSLDLISEDYLQTYVTKSSTLYKSLNAQECTLFVKDNIY